MSYNIKDNSKPDGLNTIAGHYKMLYNELSSDFEVDEDPVYPVNTLKLSEEIHRKFTAIGTDDISSVSPVKKTLTDAVLNLGRKVQSFETMEEAEAAIEAGTLEDKDLFVVEEYASQGIPLVLQEDVLHTLADCDEEAAKGVYADPTLPASAIALSELHTNVQGALDTVEEMRTTLSSLFTKSTAYLESKEVTTNTYWDLAAYVPSSYTLISITLNLTNCEGITYSFDSSPLRLYMSSVTPKTLNPSVTLVYVNSSFVNVI